MSCRVLTSSVALLLLAAPAAAQVEAVYPGLHLPLVTPTFSPEDEYVVADMDLDGLPDIVGAQLEWLEIARGLPQGGFAPVESFPLVGSSKLCLAVGALDGDGWPDVALGDFKQRVVVSHGAGGGVFGFSADYFVGNGKPYQVAIDDLDHDGTGDLLSGTDSTPGWLNVNFANGTGGYLGSQSWTPGIEITDLEIADLDGDGWTDVVCCDSYADRMAVMRGDGAGGFLPAQLYVTADNPRDILVAPLDGDADLDVLLIAAGPSAPAPGIVRTWLGDGTGALSAAGSTHVDSYPAGGTLHDLDTDGDLDAVVAALGNQMAQVLHNDGTGAFTPAEAVSLNHWVVGPEVLDVTADGVPDLLVHSQQENAALFPAQADGSFPVLDRWLGADGQVRAMDVARVDFDDIPDIVYTGFGEPVGSGNAIVGTVLGKAGGLQTTAILSLGYKTSLDVRLGDVDGDTLADVVLTHHADPPGLQIGHGNGAGQFGPPKKGTFPDPGLYVDKLALADLDGDGWRDVIGLASDVESDLLTFTNTSATDPGTFAVPAVFDGGKFTFTFETGDFDGDGAADVALLVGGENHLKDSYLQTHLGDGAGGLVPGPVTAFQGAIDDLEGLAVADFDLDGRLDAAVGQDYDAPLTLALGDGAGAFVPGAWLPKESGTGIMTAGDVDGDGWPDLLYPGGAGTLALRRSDGAGGLLEPETYAISGFEDIVLADFTQDWRLDVVLAGPSDVSGFDTQIQLHPNVVEAHVWTDMGFGLAGKLGEPKLTGTGELLSGTPGFLRLTFAASSTLAALFVSADANAAPFKGGTLVPLPPQIVGFVFTNAQGVLDLPWAAWPSDQPGATWFFQFGVLDAAAPKGVALSNAVMGTEPD